MRATGDGRDAVANKRGNGGHIYVLITYVCAFGIDLTSNGLTMENACTSKKMKLYSGFNPFKLINICSNLLIAH